MRHIWRPRASAMCSSWNEVTRAARCMLEVGGRHRVRVVHLSVLMFSRLHHGSTRERCSGRKPSTSFDLVPMMRTSLGVIIPSWRHHCGISFLAPYKDREISW